LLPRAFIVNAKTSAAPCNLLELSGVSHGCRGFFVAAIASCGEQLPKGLSHARPASFVIASSSPLAKVETLEMHQQVIIAELSSQALGEGQNHFTYSRQDTPSAFLGAAAWPQLYHPLTNAQGTKLHGLPRRNHSARCLTWHVNVSHDVPFDEKPSHSSQKLIDISRKLGDVVLAAVCRPHEV